jgi:hypothetical protein
MGCGKEQVMDLTILRVEDQTPNCLTTGFLLKLACQVEDGAAFELALPLIVTREVVAQRVPLARLAIDYLKTQGLDDWPNFMLDTRHRNLSEIERTEPVFPVKVPLGGTELVARQAVSALTDRREDNAQA